MLSSPYRRRYQAKTSSWSTTSSLGVGGGEREALISPIAIGLEGVTYGELQKFILSIRKLLHWEDGQMLEQASQRSHHSTSNVSAQEQF